MERDHLASGASPSSLPGQSLQAAFPVNIQTVQFAHILETRDLATLHDFLSQTAFVISHKSESIETILRVLWYIPVNSTIIIVTNCQEEEQAELVSALKMRLANHRKTYVIHQKDAEIARLFSNTGVPHILGADGKVSNGKGEGMYIGALAAHLLDYPRWLIFYDADNFVPSALLEYTLAMCKLFLPAPEPAYARHVLGTHPGYQAPSALHNVRICWASKPDLDNPDWDARIMGRTTRVVSPLFESLLAGWFDIHDQPISSSNAGEQGMTVKAATSLRFSSGFSVETFLLLDLLFQATVWRGHAEKITFQQYLSQSPHFHEKKGDEHIKRMIEESLGCFFAFESALPDNVKQHLQRVYDEFELERVDPIVYPPLQDLPLESYKSLMTRYALFLDAQQQDMLAETPYQDLLPVEVALQELMPVEVHYQPAEANLQELVTAGTACQDILRSESNVQELRMVEANGQETLVAEVNNPMLLISEAGYQNFLLPD
jgi:mannosyl-3-phosphoglycerate synthase